MGLFFISLVLVGWNRFRQSSGSDIYVILSSLDLDFVVFKERFVDLFTQVFSRDHTDRNGSSIVFLVPRLNTCVNKSDKSLFEYNESRSKLLRIT